MNTHRYTPRETRILLEGAIARPKDPACNRNPYLLDDCCPEPALAPLWDCGWAIGDHQSSSGQAWATQRPGHERWFAVAIPHPSRIFRRADNRVPISFAGWYEGARVYGPPTLEQWQRTAKFSRADIDRNRELEMEDHLLGGIENPSGDVRIDTDAGVAHYQAPGVDFINRPAPGWRR